MSEIKQQDIENETTAQQAEAKKPWSWSKNWLPRAVCFLPDNVYPVFCQLV